MPPRADDFRFTLNADAVRNISYGPAGDTDGDEVQTYDNVYTYTPTFTTSSITASGSNNIYGTDCTGVVDGWTTRTITIDPNAFNPPTIGWTYQLPDNFETAEINSAQEARDKKDEFKDKSCVKIKGNTLVELLERIEELEDLNMKLEKYANAELAEEWERIMKG